MDERSGGALTLTVLLGDLHVVATAVLGTVEVVGERNALGPAGIEEHLVERTRAAEIGDAERPRRAVQRRLAVDRVVLRLDEVRQDVVEAPPRIAEFLPVVVVRPRPAGVDHRVDRARSTQCLAAWLEPAPSVEARLGHRLVVPTVDPPRHREREGHRDPDRQVPALATRFEQTDRDRWVLAETAGHDAPGRSAPDDDVIELVHAPNLVAPSSFPHTSLAATTPPAPRVVPCPPP